MRWPWSRERARSRRGAARARLGVEGLEGRQLLADLSIGGGAGFPQPELINTRVARIQGFALSREIVIEGTDRADEITISHPMYGGIPDTLTVVVTIKDRATQAVLATATWTYGRPEWVKSDTFYVYGYGGDDRVINTLDRSNAVVHGGWGDDWITDALGPYAQYDHIELHGDDGDDLIEGCGSLHGGAGSDTLVGLGTQYGERSFLYGGPGFDTLTGGADGDYLYGMGGYDLLYGGPSNDFLYGGEDGDTLYGEDGLDWLFGDEGYDSLYGGAQDDHLYGGADGDELFGGDGADRLYGELDGDKLHGGAGDDLLYGGPGDDDLFGEAGFDRLYGEDGRDDLSGGYDGVADELWGGAGSDKFVILYQRKLRKRAVITGGVYYYYYYWDYTVIESNDRPMDREEKDSPDGTEVGVVVNPYGA